MNVAQATEYARDVLGEHYFRPVSGRKVGNTIIIKGELGGLGRTKVTFEIPDNEIADVRKRKRF